MGSIISFVIGFIASFIANILMPEKVIWLKNWWIRRKLRQFWGKPEGRSKKAYIFYPSYPNPGVDRTTKIGYYLSNEDAETVEHLHRGLAELGFDCHRREVSEHFNADYPMPSDGIIILVCGPKLDPTTKQVVYDPWIGGNPASSWFYHRNHGEMGIELFYDNINKRKQYRILSPILKSEITMHSPQDERPPKNFDKGLLVRFKVGEQFFFLCWGIHGSATRGAVQVALDSKILKSFPLHSPDIIAAVEAKKIDDISGDVVVKAEVYTLERRPVEKSLKPNPFKAGEWLPAESPVYGLSYLWATKENIISVKEGNYTKLAPVAAEFDVSLKCPYNCPWCAYQNDKTGDVLDDSKKALNIVDRLSESGVRLVVLTGGGEPLESNCVEAVAERCRHHKMVVILYTNGLLLNDLRAYHLMSRDISEIRISLDDVSDQYSYTTVHGIKRGSIKGRGLNQNDNAMEVIEENTRQLLRLRARNGFSTRVGASFLVSDKTLPNLEKSAETLSKWLHEVGPFDYVVIRPAVEYWPGGVHHDAYFKGTPADISMLRNAAQQFKKKKVARHVFVSWQRFGDLNGGSEIAYNKCRASTLWLNIGPDGTAYLCCETKHKNKFKLGDILKISLDELSKSDLINIDMSILSDSDRCPMRLCKPSALNRVFDDIESSKKKGGLSRNMCDWLDKVGQEHGRNAETLIPSVSGIYEEYPTPLLNDIQ